LTRTLTELLSIFQFASESLDVCLQIVNLVLKPLPFLGLLLLGSQMIGEEGGYDEFKKVHILAIIISDGCNRSDHGGEQPQISFGENYQQSNARPSGSLTLDIAVLLGTVFPFLGHL
jgi:hypothetical protein